MSLAKIFSEIEKRIPDGVTFRAGRKDLIARTEAPPRVVLVIGAETWESPHGQGGDGAKFPRRLATRASVVEAHVYGKDIAECEDLVETIANICQELFPGSHRRGPGAWVGESVSDRGEVYVLSLTFLIQVSRREVHLKATGGFSNTPELVTS